MNGHLPDTGQRVRKILLEEVSGRGHVDYFGGTCRLDYVSFVQTHFKLDEAVDECS